MIFKWESEDERILRLMKISASKKLEWLYEINKFLDKFSSKDIQKIRRKLKAV